MAEMVRWEPARGMLSLREAMDRLFEESFLRPDWFGIGDAASAAVPLDVFETENQVVVKAATPGVKPEDIEVTITGEVLTIKGEMKAEEKIEKGHYIRQERRFGSFCRQLTIPGGTDASQVKATFEHGILTLELPKVAPAKPKTVKIGTK